MEKKFDLKKDGFNLYWWRIVEIRRHPPRRADPFLGSGATVEKIPADTLVVPLAVVDVTAKAAQSPDYLLSRDDLGLGIGRKIVAWRCIPAGRSTSATRPNTPARMLQACFISPAGPEAAEWLMKERTILGSRRRHAVARQRSVEGLQGSPWLPSGRWGLENVANLDKVPAAGATLVVGVAKVKDATGGPARLIALV